VISAMSAPGTTVMTTDPSRKSARCWGTRRS
jgi:hypothetical protein